MDGWMEFLPILKDFVACLGRYPAKTPSHSFVHLGLNFDNNFMTAKLSARFATLPRAIIGVTYEKMNAKSCLVPML